MSMVAQLEHRFVKSVPRELTFGVLYVSLEYCTMLHLCACGCGSKVVTPLSPNDWSMTFNGNTITVWPSIGSWSLPCQSHYVIKHGKVIWAGQWSDGEIKRGREADLVRKRGRSSKIRDRQPELSTEFEKKPITLPWPLRIIRWFGDKFQ